MAIYDNIRKGSPLMAVEFSPVEQGNFAFFYVDRPGQRDEIFGWVKDQLGQEIMAETVVNGHPVLVTRGDRSQAEIMKLVEARGDKLALHVEKKGFNFWKWRSIASVAGQSLQMLSATTQVEKAVKGGNGIKRGDWIHKGIDTPTLMFAVLNMTANVMGYMLGSQKMDDKYRLTYLKDQSNRKLEGHLQPGEQLPDVHDQRDAIRERTKPHKLLSAGQKVKGFLQRNSVTVGEIGLRYVAAIGLVFPMLVDKKGHGGWGKIPKYIAEGDFTAKTWGKTLNSNKWMLRAGCGYLVGKFIALFTKVKDPYEPKEHTWVDTMREDVLFKVGSLIEATSGLLIGWNGLNHKHISFDRIQNKVMGGERPIQPMRDYAGGIGGAIFATGYLIRLGAKFGEKRLNMKELQAHISDSLALTKPEEMPQLLADSAAAVKNHFNKEPLEFGKLYSQIMTDLYQHNRTTFPTLEGTPEQQVAKMNTLTNTTPGKVQLASNDTQDVPRPAVQGQKVHVLNEKRTERPAAPAASHAEQAERTATQASLSI